MDVRMSSLAEGFLLVSPGLLFIELQPVASDVFVVWIPTPHRPKPRQDSQEEEEEEEEDKPIAAQIVSTTSNAPQAIFSLIAQLQISTGLHNVHLHR